MAISRMEELLQRLLQRNDEILQRQEDQGRKIEALQAEVHALRLQQAAALRPPPPPQRAPTSQELPAEDLSLPLLPGLPPGNGGLVDKLAQAPRQQQEASLQLQQQPSLQPLHLHGGGR